MIELIGGLIIVTRPGQRHIVIQPLTALDSVAALRTMGYGEAVAAAFGLSGGNRETVIALAIHLRLLEAI